MTQQAYLVFDIGTGNARVAVTDIHGQILAIERADIAYQRDPLYPDACSFVPEILWEQIIGLTRTVLSAVTDARIAGITSTSQRQGIVLIDGQGQPYLGLPNIDNRGREWEAAAGDHQRIYQQTGRTPSALFSGMKLVGLRERRRAQYDVMSRFTSISDWVTYQLSGILVYEPSQASETLLYDVAQADWSLDMCSNFGIDLSTLPPLVPSGTVLGTLTEEIAVQLGLSSTVPVIVGGGDTQLAMASTGAKPGDMVIVSGTTTPIAKVTADYISDPNSVAWINAHTWPGQWLVETNPGITGLNYQRLKSIFYPNESYAVMEQEIGELGDSECVSALGAYLSSEKNARVQGGFLFDAPISDQLSRAHFVRAALYEIAFSVKVNFEQLMQVTPLDNPVIRACGGGLQSRLLAQTLANLLGREIRIAKGYEQASVAGAVALCNTALGYTADADEYSFTSFRPEYNTALEQDYQQWRQTQLFFASQKQALAAEVSAADRHG
ncbi:FGGY-family carbohydrate kinase [Paenibacillus bovis]|uniref:Sugar kinase n=1 Tax=Paenibacillus bovis TaxID=1616788 RepID=A0A172ZJF1_9BACL|nr:FGGY family carbohydrate kinase [Paenibacillus bovis]ANF97774.1 sugar kinase [Paenibacillus bovis]